MIETKTPGLTASDRSVGVEASWTESIGPQRVAEPMLMRRVRFHQSWYRLHVLGLTRFGSVSGASGKPLGSILHPDDAAADRNFIDKSAAVLYRRRRQQGWGVDPTRCTGYLGSSQALTFNLFGALSEDMDWTKRCLALVLGRADIDRVLAMEIECAPARRSEHLGDQTRIDVVLTLATSAGTELVAIEVKYADRFNSRQVDLATDRYFRFAQRSRLWRDAEGALKAPSLNQLVRTHALAVSMAEQRHGPAASASVLVLVHGEDETAEQIVDEYASVLSDPQQVQHRSHDQFVLALRASAPTSDALEVASALHRRYCDESQSEAAWRAFRLAHDRRRAKMPV